MQTAIHAGGLFLMTEAIFEDSYAGIPVSSELLPIRTSHFSWGWQADTAPQDWGWQLYRLSCGVDLLCNQVGSCWQSFCSTHWHKLPRDRHKAVWHCKGQEKERYWFTCQMRSWESVSQAAVPVASFIKSSMTYAKPWLLPARLILIILSRSILSKPELQSNVGKLCYLMLARQQALLLRCCQCMFLSCADTVYNVVFTPVPLHWLQDAYKLLM